MRRLLTLLVMLTAGLAAQVTVEPDDTVSIFSDLSTPQQKKTTASKYYLATALLPGAGHIMGNQSKKAFAFLAVDAGLAAGAAFTLFQSRDILAESRGYASQHSGTRSSRGSTDAYWRYLASPDFLSSKDFNTLVERAGQPDLEYLADNDQWQWDSEFSRTHYRGMRDASTRYKTVGSFLLGALILDRAIAMLDLRIGIRRGTIAALPLIDPVSGARGIAIAGTF